MNTLWSIIIIAVICISIVFLIYYVSKNSGNQDAVSIESVETVQAHHSDEHPATEQQSIPEQHAPAQHAPAQHAPIQHAPIQHAPAQHAPVQHIPEQHAPAQHIPEHHAPAQYAPAQYAPEQHAPAQHAPEQHIPAQHIPEHHIPEQPQQAQSHSPRLQPKSTHQVPPIESYSNSVESPSYDDHIPQSVIELLPPSVIEPLKEAKEAVYNLNKFKGTSTISDLKWKTEASASTSDSDKKDFSDIDIKQFYENTESDSGYDPEEGVFYPMVGDEITFPKIPKEKRDDVKINTNPPPGHKQIQLNMNPEHTQSINTLFNLPPSVYGMTRTGDGPTRVTSGLQLGDTYVLVNRGPALEYIITSNIEISGWFPTVFPSQKGVLGQNESITFTIPTGQLSQYLLSLNFGFNVAGSPPFSSGSFTWDYSKLSKGPIWTTHIHDDKTVYQLDENNFDLFHKHDL